MSRQIQTYSDNRQAVRRPNHDLFEEQNNLLIHDTEQDLKNFNDLRAFTLNSVQSNLPSDPRPFKNINNEPVLNNSTNSQILMQHQ